ncbi:MAG: histidine kinase [Ginsengibacter sp.]
MNFYNFIFSETPLLRLRRHLVFWMAVFLYHFIRISFLYPANLFLKDILSIILGALIWGVLLNVIFSYMVVYYLVPRFFIKKKYIQFTIYLLTLFIFLFGLSLLNFLINKKMGHAVGGTSSESQLVYLKASAIRILGNPPLICLLLLSLKKIKDWYLKQSENKVLARENSNAELQLLKAQIHPHFLFNTLNNIYFFTLSEPIKAKSLVGKLENLLHYMINECNVPSVLLSKEISMMNDYFELEKIRYNNLDIDVKINGDYENKKIAPLLMIPFIENSFKHGTSKMLKDPWIKLTIQSDKHMLHFVLVNNKPVEVNTNHRYGIGLNNVKKRLSILYPQKHYLNIEPTANTFTVNMQIPLE